MEDEHPDDTGATPPDEPTAARDGDPSNVSRLPDRGQPLAERQEQEPEPEQQELFSVEEAGKTVTFAQLVKRGTPQEVRYTMTGRSLGSNEGLIDPYATTTLIVADCVVDSVKPQYIRDENQAVSKVILYVTLKPRAAVPALSEAGRVMIDEGRKAKAAAAA